MKKEFLMIAAFGLLVVSCHQSQTSDVKSSTNSQGEVKIVGDDKDTKGCVGSAGYRWSVTKNKCIRVWEEGTRFEQYQAAKTNGRPKIAYVVLSDDKSKAELIFDDSDKLFLLSKAKVTSGNNNPVYYQNEEYELEIRFRQNAFWITRENKDIYFNEYSEKDGFNTKL